MRIIFPNQKALDDYIITKRIGSGGQSFCYQADYLKKCKPWEKTVFLKQYHDLEPVDTTLVETAKFFQEFRNKLGRYANRVCLPLKIGIDHNSIIAIYPWLAGTKLTDTLKQEVPYSDRVRIAVALVSTLKKFHENEIAHLDLKPDNIVVNNEKGEVWIQIIDLDAAKVEGIGIRERGLFTPEWASPEQVFPNEFEDINTKSDVFSLGRILLLLLTGKDPYQNLKNYQNDIIEKNFRIEATPIHKDVIEVLAQCLNVEPHKRPSIATILWVLNQHHNTELLSTDPIFNWSPEKSERRLVHITLAENGKPFSRIYYKDVLLTQNELRGSGVLPAISNLLRITVKEDGVSIYLLSKKDKVFINDKKVEVERNYRLIGTQVISINDVSFLVQVINY